MKKHTLILLALFLGLNTINAHPVDMEKAKTVGTKFACAKFNNDFKESDLQLVYTGIAQRGETCFYVFNTGETGFVIVSADDKFTPIVGYSDQGNFITENMSPELAFYLDKIMEARTSPNVVIEAGIAEEWQSVMASGQLSSRNGGRGVDFICTTTWNQDSPYNLYAPEANGGPGGRCYAGCVATAMSQIMKRWNHPVHGTSSHSYYCSGYGTLSANFGNTYYDWDNMPDRLGVSQTEIEAVALLMYHCGVAVDMNFTPSGSGASSYDVPYAINHYFSYSNQSNLKDRDSYSLVAWRNLLKESLDLNWPIYYSGCSDTGCHAFVCDGYDDSNHFHFNWGWGGNSDGWFIVDEIDYASWAQAVFNFVPSDVYTYQPLQPDNFSVSPGNDFDYSASLSWINPTRNIHSSMLSNIDQIVITRNGEVIHTFNNATPGAAMSFTDHYMPAVVDYAVYAVVHNAYSVPSVEKGVLLGPTCNWTVQMSAPNSQGWKDGYLSFVNEAGDEVAQLTITSIQATRTVSLPLGHVEIHWQQPLEVIENMGFTVKNSEGVTKVSFQGSSSDLDNGLFYIANNTCGDNDEEISEGPTNLNLDYASGHAVLSWNAPEILQVVNYHIYRDNELYGLTTERTFTDSQGVDEFHNYYVTAFTENGESKASNKVNVALGSNCAIPTNLHYEIVSPSKVKLYWDAPEGGGVTGYDVYRREKGGEFKRIKSLTHTYYSSTISKPDNCYEFAVVAYYQDSDCTSGFASTQDNPNLNFVTVNKTIIPQDLGFQIQDDHVVLQWKEATKAENYNVYRDGQLIAQTVENEYVDEDVTPNQGYHYTVTGATAFIESNPCIPVFVDGITGLGEAVGTADVQLYPNPTKGQLTVAAEGLLQVTVFNVTGQEVLRQSVQGDRAVINLSAEPQGCYFIQVMTERGPVITKVVRL